MPNSGGQKPVTDDCRRLKATSAVNQIQFLILLKKPGLLGGCCGGDHRADLEVDQATGGVVITYLYL